VIYQSGDSVFRAKDAEDGVYNLGLPTDKLTGGISSMIKKGWATDEGEGLYQLTAAGEKEALSHHWKKPNSSQF
jgi:hypothetical protein